MKTDDTMICYDGKLGHMVAMENRGEYMWTPQPRPMAADADIEIELEDDTAPQA